ncbi:hypothetical protein OGATHE_003712 [Ogataea polymorpha]|uniref:Uncharacterized protein n=1 Tax=Ogataea polymorpha TaxID=460523 RepID=A0A9P8P451_9ASCO|nr:hypothetical protein OGATHE_003712 [Ogataea polymorpha]
MLEITELPRLRTRPSRLALPLPISFTMISNDRCSSANAGMTVSCGGSCGRFCEAELPKMSDSRSSVDSWGLAGAGAASRSFFVSSSPRRSSSRSPVVADWDEADLVDFVVLLLTRGMPS